MYDFQDSLNDLELRSLVHSLASPVSQMRPLRRIIQDIVFADRFDDPATGEYYTGHEARRLFCIARSFIKP